MARLGTSGANAALDGLSGSNATNRISHCSLHTADPTTTGGSETTGGGYARQAVSWNAAASAAKTNSGALTFSTTGASAMTHFGLWDASSAGNYGIGGALASSVTAATITVAAGALSIGAS